MTPNTAASMRTSLDARIVAQAPDGSMTAGQLRRRLVFQRVLRRLSEDERWILKGGYLLEARLAAGARSTRDLDLVTRVTADLSVLQAAFASSLARDPDADFFRFETTKASALRVDALGRPGWRFSVTASMAGRTFDGVRVDVLQRAEEVADATELFEVACPVHGLPFSSAHVQAVDIAQHAAEKFHALCRSYSGDRPSTRAKDLVDIVLMAEAGLLPDPRLGSRLRAVFLSRDGCGPPPKLPDPPASWQRDYLTLTAELQPMAQELAAAFALATEFYRDATSATTEQGVNE